MNNQEFLKKYRTNKTSVWIKIKLTDSQEFYFTAYENWPWIKKICDNKDLFIEEFQLQFRSHEVNINVPQDIDGIYFIRSILGQMGGESKHFYTVGFIYDDGKVKKDMYIIPELVKEKTYEDDIESCFEEGIIYNVGKKKKNTEKQIQA